MGYFALLYGILTIVGGLIGYLKSGSTVSLIAGGSSGVLILISAMAYLKQKPVGFYGLVALSAVLLLFFGYRLMNGAAFMPAGLMVILSTITLIGVLIQSKRSQIPKV